MADKTISSLTAAGALTGAEIVPVVQSSNSRRTTAQAIADLAAARTLITETVTSGSQASVTFSSIATTWRDLELRVRARGTNASNDVGVQLQFNGDTGANYDYQQTFHASSSTFVQLTGQTLLKGGQIAAASATANYPGLVIFDIADYRGTTFYKSLFSRAHNRESVNRTMVTTAVWKSTAAISSILVSLSAGNFVDGSVVSLYGLQ